MAADAQTSCNASMTWTQTVNSYNIVFTNTSVAVPGVPSSPFAGTSRMVWINGQYYSSNPNYTHTFPGPGSYPVVAYVSYMDSVNGVAIYCNDTTQYTVIVTQQPCVASITSITGTGASRTFVANGGSAAAGTTYSWDFGDGSAAGTGVTTSHTYGVSGTYTVTLTTTSGGCTSSLATTVFVYVAPALNCATVSNNFTMSGTGATRVFYPSATPTNYPRTHFWNFGNGSTATSYGSGSVTSAFTAPGTYTVCLLTMWTDSANNITCTDTVCQNLTITTGTGGTLNCANTNTGYSATAQGLSGYFTPYVTPANTTGVTVVNNWSFGDGSATVVTYGSAGTSHTYTSGGVYNIHLVTQWVQSGTTNVLCVDTVSGMFTVAAQNYIYGYVAADSVPNQPNDTFKVWLISFDAGTNMLTAVDSTIVTGMGAASFSFTNKPAGIYRTKAHKLYQTAGALGYVPTYRDSSLTWSGAQTFTHNNGLTWSGAIYLRHGLTSSGPGFIGGSVLSGANKGTADGDPVVNQLVFLRNATTGELVQSAYTNASGQYSFSSIPLGSYTVYPEEMNYATTPSSSITLSAGSASSTNILFKKDDVDMDIKPVSATGINAAAASGLDFSVMPNPTSGKVSLIIPGIATSQADVRVTSMTGQVVFSSRMAVSRAASLDLSHLQSGMYFVKISTEAGEGTAKLVITR